MKIAGLIKYSVVDGPGFRFVVFTQGCHLRCKGCHNPETWDFGGGTDVPLDDIIEDMLSNPLADGLTLSGGEPFDQAADCASLAAIAREKGLNIWVYTGKTFEELIKEARKKPAVKKLLYLTDVLVDGKFIITERTLSKKWCGSKNQRVIDIPKSLITGKGELLE